jgi:hypothetical protein
MQRATNHNINTASWVQIWHQEKDISEDREIAFKFYSFLIAHIRRVAKGKMAAQK